MKRIIMIDPGAESPAAQTASEQLPGRDSAFPAGQSPAESLTLEEAVNNFERRLIVRALKKSNGIQTKAAELLGTTRRILRYRMDKLGIQVSACKES